MGNLFFLLHFPLLTEEVRQGGGILQTYIGDRGGQLAAMKSTWRKVEKRKEEKAV